MDNKEEKDIESFTPEEAALEAVRLHEQGRGSYLVGQYSRAKELHKKALHIRNELYGPDHFEVAASLNEIGCVHRAAGDILGAKLCFKAALEIFEKSKGVESAEFSTALSNLGHSMSEIGEPEYAIQCLNRSLRIDIALHGPFAAVVGDGYNSLGVMHMMSGDFKDAAEYFQKATEVAKRIFGLEHQLTAERMNNAGLALVETKDVEMGLSLLVRSHDITLRVLGENHHDTARSRNNIGAVLNANGNPDEAIPWLEKAVAYYRERKKAQPEKFTECANNLGTALFNMERLKDSAAVFEESLVEELNFLGTSHNNIASKLSILGSIYHAMGNLGAARKRFEEAIKIRSRLLGDTHEGTVAVRERLEAVIQDQENIN